MDAKFFQTTPFYGLSGHTAGAVEGGHAKGSSRKVGPLAAKFCLAQRGAVAAEAKAVTRCGGVAMKIP